METHLRLAERQGLLARAHISPVQTEALKILIYLDEVKSFQTRSEQFKFALAARSDFRVEKIFPEYFPDEVVEEGSEEEEEGAAYDYDSVEWKSPSNTDQETLNKMLEMLGSASGQMGGAQTQQMMAGMQGGWV